MDAFALTYDGFDPDQEGLREALTSTGNGYLCARGTAEWEDADGVHYPGTYAHGVYNRETTILGGLPVLNEDLVNLPNWLVVKVRIEGEDAVRLADVELLDYRHGLDIRNAVVVRELRFRDRSSRETRLRSRRFVSMADVHRAGIEWTLTAENWSGRVEVVCALDGRVTNSGVARYQQLEGRHLDPVSPRTFGPEVIALKVQTRQSNLYISQAARSRVFEGTNPVTIERSLYQTEDYIQQVLAFEVRQGVPVRVEKLVVFSTSRDPATSDSLTKAGTSAGRSGDFEAELTRHRSAWEELWRVCDLQVQAEHEVQRLLRLHTCHLLQVCSRHTADIDAGVPARGLNGEAYRGHVFWDELYVYPFLNYRMPEVTRGLLMYRYRRLGEARAAAHEAGFRGAMFPWQSGSEGKEETQRVHLNPLTGRWEPDLSRNQRHVNAAIFYNIWHYFQATQDLAFLRDYGAEMMLEIARFWASIAHFNPDRDRYEIHGVMGPDEFHEKYPGATEGGLRNNAYTNVMVAWLCELARRAGRHRDVVLPVLARGAEAAVRSPRLRVPARHGAQERCLLRPPHVAWLDAELHRLRRGPRGAGRRELLGSLPRSPEERRQRRSGWDDQGGDPRGRDGRHARPRPAQLYGHSCPRRGPSVRPQAAGADRRAVVLDAVPTDPAPGDGRRRPADARRPSRGRQPADQGWGRRSGSRLRPRGPLHVRVTAGPKRRAATP
jgi:trehalose/maltose hydrolase-like predicted phosphorylase